MKLDQLTDTVMAIHLKNNLHHLEDQIVDEVVHSLNVLNFVYVVVLDVETALDNANKAIQERLE